jgi:hypothetical protein
LEIAAYVHAVTTDRTCNAAQFPPLHELPADALGSRRSLGRVVELIDVVANPARTMKRHSQPASGSAYEGVLKQLVSQPAHVAEALKRNHASLLPK